MLQKKKFIDLIRSKDFKIWGWSNKPSKPFDLSPETFLEFAKENIDFLDNLKNKLSVISYVKLAIHCRTDILLYNYGYLKKSNKWNFPQKIDFLRENDIIAPRILKKINRIRNSLEHDYEIPTTAEVEDAYDVALLFENYAEKMCKVPESINIHFEEGKLEVIFNREDYCFIVHQGTDHEFKIFEEQDIYDDLLNEFIDTAKLHL